MNTEKTNQPLPAAVASPQPCADPGLEELLADKNRLDWLHELKYFCVGIHCRDGRFVYQLVYQVEAVGFSDRGDSLRAAIDSAMASPGTGNDK